MDKLPLRRHDNARVADVMRNTYKVYCEPNGVTYIKRQEIERERGKRLKGKEKMNYNQE